jgi:hypothetical protein
MTENPGTSLIPTGQVTVCCALHQGGNWGSCCVNDDNCTPCCERCPNCPAIAIESGIAMVAAATHAVIRNLP